MEKDAETPTPSGKDRKVYITHEKNVTLKFAQYFFPFAVIDEFVFNFSPAQRVPRLQAEMVRHYGLLCLLRIPGRKITNSAGFTSKYNSKIRDALKDLELQADLVHETMVPIVGNSRLSNKSSNINMALK